MDLQYILDPYACVMYIASYMLKSEKAMTELLRQVSRECASEDIKTQLRRLGSVFVTTANSALKKPCTGFCCSPSNNLAERSCLSAQIQRRRGHAS